MTVARGHFSAGAGPGAVVAGAVLAALAWVAVAGCAGSVTERRDGLDASSVPSEVRPDYVVFAQRCSKCHSLARPLYSGITDDGFWREYVEKMRRQPASGIREVDTVPILRFLHWYSVEGQAQKAKTGGDGG